MTVSQAVTIERKKYAEACANHNPKKAHIHRLVIQRLTRKEMTYVD